MVSNGFMVHQTQLVVDVVAFGQFLLAYQKCRLNYGDLVAMDTDPVLGTDVNTSSPLEEELITPNTLILFLDVNILFVLVVYILVVLTIVLVAKDVLHMSMDII